MNDKVKDTIMTTLIIFIFTFLTNSAISYFTADKAVIRIGSIVKVEDTKYELALDISNFSSKNIQDIKLLFPNEIELSDIRSNKSLEIEKINSDAITGDDSIFKINEIGANEKISTIITMNQLIDIDDITLNKNDYKIRISYAEDEKNPFISQIPSIVAMAILYAVIASIFSWYSEKKFTYKRTLLTESLIESKEMATNCSRELDAFQKRSIEIDISNRKHKLLLLCRIKDYKKELDFWRDTLRKILYGHNNNNNEINEIFNCVTDNLKTYGTKQEKDINYDDIKILNSILNNNKSD